MRKFGIVTDVKDSTFGSLVVIIGDASTEGHVEVKMLKSTSPKSLSEGMHDLYLKESITTIGWDFVVEFYDGYYQCDEIAHNDDLQRLSDGEFEDGDCAHNLLLRAYNGKENSPQINIDLQNSNEYIYSKAWEDKFGERQL